ncbi:MAG TPA: phosphotransferase [Streptosporangiaceae bacterium]|nr:phosphotransferase [Streptosporangiaceae bacterium]
MTFEDTLATWLPAQRWYAGSEATIRDLAITADTTLAAGDPELRHLIVTVSGGGETARYQVLVGLRAQVPAALRHAVIGPAGPGRTAYEALHDPELTKILLRGIAEQATVGPIRFAREPGAVIDAGLDSLMLTGEQSNTSLIFGESAILKVLRRLFPGQNPDLEVNRALARHGSAHVAEPYGWIEASDDDDSILLAILSRFLPGASDGWSLAATSLRDLYSGDGVRAQGTIRPDQAGGDFAGEAFRLGAATAEVHADLAAAFGVTDVPPAAFADLAGRMTRKLDSALAEVPGLRPYAGKLRGCYADLAAIPGPMPVQRIHGDYHLGQVLRTATGWVVLDFEGEPLVPLRQRRAPGIALRDVAGMLRSFDYAARHQLIDRPDTDKLRDLADEWAERSQAAFCKGYADAGGMDPQANAVLLRALMLDKAVYEVVYEARHRPSWLSIPLDSIAAALCQTSPPSPSSPSSPPGPPDRSATLKSTGSWTGCTTTRTRSSARTRDRPGRSCAPCAR